MARYMSPEHLQAWIQDQDGLKIDRKPIHSITDFLEAYELVSRTPGSLKIFDKIGIFSLVRYGSRK